MQPHSIATTARPNLIGVYARSTFSSLRVRNYRLYFIGQGLSLIGTWMQGLAQSWLVATLTSSPMMVGLVAAMQFLPVLVFAPYGGVLADRFRKRRVLLVTQSLAAILALVLAILTVSGAVRIWMVFVLAAGLGVVNALDNPTRQSFIHDLVGPDVVRNAVTLNALEVNLMRVVGPALAGVLIVWIGLGWCFLVNAASFLAVLVCLVMMRPSEMHLAPRLKPARGQLKEGLAYAGRTPVIRDVLLMMAVVGMITYEFQVTLTNFAKFTFETSALGPSFLTSAMGVGAVVGGLLTAGSNRSPLRTLTLASFGFAASMVALAAAPSVYAAAAVMIVVGAFSLMFTSLTNTILQLESAPQMRGRVMALWSVAFLGTTALGAPLVGWIAETVDPRAAIAFGAVAAVGSGLIGIRALRRDPHERSENAVVEQAEVAEKEEYF